VSPELRHLRYFLAVAEEHSFARAAVRLHVVQQTLSAAVQQLEQELGVQLLVRTTRKVELTAAGRALAEEGRRTLESAERSWEAARRAARQSTAELRVAYTATLGSRTVPALHDAVAERLDGVSVTWRELWSSEVVDGVSTGRFDAGLARHAERARPLAYETVAEEPQGVILGAGHPLAGAEEIPLAALADDAILTFPREMRPGTTTRWPTCSTAPASCPTSC